MKILITFLFAISHFAVASSNPCVILLSNLRPAPKLQDGLFEILTSAQNCPTNVLKLEEEFKKTSWELSSYMVANRGRANPNEGSFSLFEVASAPPTAKAGEIFFGHFTHTVNQKIELDQAPDKGKLMIEIISFDAEKNLYNFYELIGQGNAGQWFYRGDSRDALLDNAYLHRPPPPGEEKFGTRMRCSACHNSGGPIMKELSFPHNDWWNEDLPLIFGENDLSPDVIERVNRLQNASELSKTVIAGMKKLTSSESYQNALKSRSLPEQLRPLFCTSEINLASSPERMPDNSEEFTIPGDSIIHPLLNKPLLRFKKQSYQRLLDSFDLRFPEGTEQDADHIWLTPVVSQQNIAAIEKLIENGIVSQKTAVDILMIDFKKPALSQPRCALLKFVPQKFSADWQAKFMAALARSTEPQARELKKYLLEPDAFAKFHKPAIDNYITSLSDEKALPALFKNLLILRLEVFVNEISKNPLGQILEPGFRVIFPIAGTKISMN